MSSLTRKISGNRELTIEWPRSVKPNSEIFFVKEADGKIRYIIATEYYDILKEEKDGKI